MDLYNNPNPPKLLPRNQVFNASSSGKEPCSSMTLCALPYKDNQNSNPPPHCCYYQIINNKKKC